MALNNQVFIYSIDTSAFYTKEEKKIQYKLNYTRSYKHRLIDKKKKYQKLLDSEKIKENLIWKDSTTDIILKCNKIIKSTKKSLYDEFKKNKSIRILRKKKINKRNIISIFESTLTRTIGINSNKLSLEIMVVQAYFFEILEDIILNGFTYNGEKYICFTASAGQIRTKKTVFIKEKTLEQYRNSLTCGLSVEEINKHGGVNINKYLAYLALCNSATDKWIDFDITKTIVVEDMETMVDGIVDFIDDKTYEITRKSMGIPITHTDGCGMILPKKSKKSKMTRAPWVKGLLVPKPFDKFIREKTKETGKYCGIIKDIYGKEHDILKEDIEVIFTKSQFKMWKYYDSWEQYKENFIKYGSQVSYCNEEEDIFGKAKLNYQMLQTLVDTTDKELEEICQQTSNNILRLGKDRKTMLKVLGVVKSNINKNYVQQAMEIYPELLNDTYSKEILKQTKKSVVKSARAAKLETDGVYTFLCPDLYAFCEYLFLGDKNPKGLLKDGEVYCNLYKNSPKLDCLRSPHLYKEHAVRNNVIDKEKERWFVTNGIYTSCHDLISKILMFDNDGDKSLVCAHETFIKIAERNMKDIVPLYYEMKKAEAEIVNEHSIYNGLKTAYTGGNIGLYSNNISKIWNSKNVTLEAIKLLCMENNFTIDFAKTLYKPTRPEKVQKLITSYTNSKVPNFFIYAKDKDKNNVAPINSSVVNRLQKIIPNPNISFKEAKLGEFDYKMLMKNSDIEIDEDIINRYTELDLKKHFMINIHEEESSNIVFLYQDIKKEILKINSDVNYVVDVLIKYLYEQKNSSYKTTLWECFGDIIVENLKNNVKDGYILCEKCGDRVKVTNNKIKYCEKCAKEILQEQKNKWKRENWNKTSKEEK